MSFFGIAHVTGAVVGLLGLLLVGCDAPPSPPPPRTIAPSNPMGSTPFILPGITDIELLAVDATNIPDETPVVGVVVENEARAYLTDGMTRMDSHIVNDRIGQRSVSVTYCDRTDCVRVLTDETATAPLALELGGFSDAQMLLRWKENMYPQSSEQIPLQAQEFQRVTWGVWKQEHPETVVYLGHAKSRFKKSTNSAAPTPETPAPTRVARP